MDLAVVVEDDDDLGLREPPPYAALRPVDPGEEPDGGGSSARSRSVRSLLTPGSADGERFRKMKLDSPIPDRASRSPPKSRPRRETEDDSEVDVVDGSRLDDLVDELDGGRRRNEVAPIPFAAIRPVESNEEPHSSGGAHSSPVVRRGRVQEERDGALEKEEEENDSTEKEEELEEVRVSKMGRFRRILYELRRLSSAGDLEGVERLVLEGNVAAMEMLGRGGEKGAKAVDRFLGRLEQSLSEDVRPEILVVVRNNRACAARRAGMTTEALELLRPIFSTPVDASKAPVAECYLNAAAILNAQGRHHVALACAQRGLVEARGAIAGLSNFEGEEEDVRRPPPQKNSDNFEGEEHEDEEIVPPPQKSSDNFEGEAHEDEEIVPPPPPPQKSIPTQESSSSSNKDDEIKDALITLVTAYLSIAAELEHLGLQTVARLHYAAALSLLPSDSSDPVEQTLLHEAQAADAALASFKVHEIDPDDTRFGPPHPNDPNRPYLARTPSFSVHSHGNPLERQARKHPDLQKAAPPKKQQQPPPTSQPPPPPSPTPQNPPPPSPPPRKQLSASILNASPRSTHEKPSTSSKPKQYDLQAPSWIQDPELLQFFQSPEKPAGPKPVKKRAKRREGPKREKKLENVYKSAAPKPSRPTVPKPAKRDRK